MIPFRQRPALRAAMYRDQRGYCALCFKPLILADSTIDHIKPIAKGGTDDWWNLQLAHKHCNVGKGSRYLRSAS
jgi:5-methylcytosine-specific restriction endonuclease McrA